MRSADPVGFETDVASSEGGGVTSDTDVRPHSVGHTPASSSAAASASRATEQQLRAEIQRLEHRFAQTVSSMTQERQEALANEAAFTRMARDSAQQLQLKLSDAESKIEFLTAFVTSQVCQCCAEPNDLRHVMSFDRAMMSISSCARDARLFLPRCVLNRRMFHLLMDGAQQLQTMVQTRDKGNTHCCCHCVRFKYKCEICLYEFCSWRLELDNSDDDNHQRSSLHPLNHKRQLHMISSSSSSDSEDNCAATRYVDPGPRPPARRGPHERSPNQPGNGLLTLASTVRGNATGDDASSSDQQNQSSASAFPSDSAAVDNRLFVRSENRPSMFEKHFFKRSEEHREDERAHQPGSTTLKTRRARPLSASRAQHSSNTTSTSQQQKQSLHQQQQQQQQMLKRMHAGLPTSSRRLYTAPPSPRVVSNSRRSSPPASPARPTSRLSPARASPNRARTEAVADGSRAASRSPARAQSHDSTVTGMQFSPKRPVSAPARVHAPSVSVSLSKSAVPKNALTRLR